MTRRLTSSEALVALRTDGKPHAERLLSNVRVDENGCWRWTAAKSKKGYARFGVGGSNMGAHRAAYVLMVGAIPDDCEIDHLCSVRDCVNPEHLEAVPHAVNVARGRTGMFPHGHRTHCDHGHPFDEENTGYRSDGAGRFCRTCRRDAVRRYNERNVEVVRQRAREARRLEREQAGIPARWPGRVHPRYQEKAA